MNRFKIRGRLYKDWRIQMVKTNEGGMTPMALNTVSGRYGPKQYLFMDVALFGTEAEQIVEATQKGDEVEFMGMLRQRQYEEKETGKKRSSISMSVKVWKKITKQAEWDPDEEVSFTDR